MFPLRTGVRAYSYRPLSSRKAVANPDKFFRHKLNVELKTAFIRVGGSHDFLRSPAEAFALIRDVERRFGPVQEFQFQRDSDQITRYHSLVFVTFKDPASYQRLPVLPTEFAFKRPSADSGQPGGVGLEDLKPFLQLQPSDVSESEDLELDENTIPYSIKQSTSNLTAPSVYTKALDVSSRTAQLFLGWGGFHSLKPISSETELPVENAFVPTSIDHFRMRSALRRYSEMISAPNPYEVSPGQEIETKVQEPEVLQVPDLELTSQNPTMSSDVPVQTQMPDITASSDAPAASPPPTPSISIPPATQQTPDTTSPSTLESSPPSALPKASVQEPAATSPSPSTLESSPPSAKPKTSAQNSAATSPSASTLESSPPSIKPKASAPQPVASSPSPSTLESSPPSAKPKASAQKPAVTSPSPSTLKSSPPSAKPKASAPKPVATSPSPSTLKSSPTSAKPKASAPKPVATSPSPSTLKSSPTSAKPKASAPKPIATSPSPAEQKPSKTLPESVAQADAIAAKMRQQAKSMGRAKDKKEEKRKEKEANPLPILSKKKPAQTSMKGVNKGARQAANEKRTAVEEKPKTIREKISGFFSSFF